jgi:adenylosuccinate synthase
VTLSYLLASGCEQLIKSLQAHYKFEYDIAKEQEDYRGYREQIKGMITDTVHGLNQAMRAGKTILAEGALSLLAFCGRTPFADSFTQAPTPPCSTSISARTPT